MEKSINSRHYFIFMVLQVDVITSAFRNFPTEKTNLPSF